MPKLTMKDLAKKLDSVGVYLDGNHFAQISNKHEVDPVELSLTNYIKTLECQRIQKKRRKTGGLDTVKLV